MSGAIVAKALNSSLGTEDFKGFDEIIKTALDQNNEILESILTDYADKSLCKGYIATEEPLFYIIKEQNVSRSSQGQVDFVIGEAITFSCNGSVVVKSNSVKGKGRLIVRLNESIIASSSLDADEGALLNVFFKIKKGDVLKINGTTEYDGEVGLYQFHTHPPLTVSINAKEANLAGFEVIE